MELREYWSAMGKRRWALLLVPIVAGGAAFAVGAQRPAKYEASSSVSVLPPNEALNPTAVRQAVTDFQAIVGQNSFQAELAAKTGLSSSAISSGLTSAQVGDSTSVNVTFTSENPDTSKSVASEAGLLALQDFVGPQVSQAEAFVTSTQKPAADAAAVVDAYTKKVGISDPSTQLATAQQILSQLQVRQSLGQDPPGALTGLIQQQQASVAKLQPIAAQYAVLTRLRDIADQVVQNARAALFAVQAQQAAIPSAVTKAANATKVSPLSALIQLVGAAAVIGFLAVALLLLLGEVLRRDREGTTVRTPVAG